MLVSKGTGPEVSQEGEEDGGEVLSTVPGDRGEGSVSKCSVKET